MAYLLDISAVMAPHGVGETQRIELADHESAPTTPWAGAMVLLQALRSDGDDRGLDGEVPPDLRAPLALLDPALRRSLDEAERAHSAQLSGSCLIALPSMTPTRNPVLDALCSWISERLQQRPPLHIVVQHLLWMDVESMELLERLITSDAGTRLHLSVDDPELLHSSVSARHHSGSLDAEHARRQLLCRRVAAIARACQSPISARNTVRPVATPRRRLSSGSPPSARLEMATDLQVLAAGMRHAVTCHAFSIALSFAERLIAMDGGDMELQQEAALAAGVSAHTLDPNDAAFSTMAADYFAQLASRSPDPAQRSHGCFRLCLHEAHHRGRLNQALVLADEAIRHAGDDSIDPDRAPLYLAWAYGARAFVQSRLGRVDEAARSCRRALALLQAGRPSHPSIPSAAIAEAIEHLQEMSARIKKR